MCSNVRGDKNESEDEAKDRGGDGVVECIEDVVVVEVEYGAWCIVSGGVVNGVPGWVAVEEIEVSEIEGEWPAGQVGATIRFLFRFITYTLKISVGSPQSL